MDAPAKGPQVELLNLGWAASPPVVLPMNDRQFRIALLLALPPLTVVVFLLSGELFKLGGNTFSSGNWDELRFGTTATTIVICGLWWWVWRHLITWNRRRAATTLALAVFVVGQVLFWQPLWHSSAFPQDDILRCAQSLADLGLWCLGCVLTWWGGYLWRRNRIPEETQSPQEGGRFMSVGTVRLAIGIALLPLLSGVFFMVTGAVNEFLHWNDPWLLVIGYLVCALLAVLVWLGVWRREVNWTWERRRWTLGLIALLLAAPFIVLWPHTGNSLVDMTVAVTPLIALAVWFAGTALVWRHRAGEMGELNLTPAAIQAARLNRSSADPADSADALAVPCGQCGYDLRGLREARCPECGWTTTVDALVRRGLEAVLAAED